MKKVLKKISLIAIIIMCLSIVGCGMPKESPTEYIQKQAIVTDYLANNEKFIDMQIEAMAEGEELTEKGKELVKTFMGSCKVTPGEESINEENKTAKIKIKYELANLGEAMKVSTADLMKSAFASAFSGKELSEAELTDMFYQSCTDYINNNPDKTLSFETEANLIVEKGSWKIENEEEFTKQVEEEFNKVFSESLKSAGE